VKEDRAQKKNKKRKRTKSPTRRGKYVEKTRRKKVRIKIVGPKRQRPISKKRRKNKVKRKKNKPSHKLRQHNKN